MFLDCEKFWKSTAKILEKANAFSLAAVCYKFSSVCSIRAFRSSIRNLPIKRGQGGSNGAFALNTAAHARRGFAC